MKVLMKKWLMWLGFIGLGAIVYGQNVTVTAPAVQLVPPQPTAQIYQDTSGNIDFVDNSSGPVALSQLATPNAFGTKGTAVSTTTTAGSELGTTYQAFLASGTVSVAALEGSVLCSTTTQQNLQVTVIVCTALKDLSSVVGIASVATSTGSVVTVYSNGWVLGLTTGTVNPGDSLATSSLSAGYLESRSTGTIGVALAAGNANGGLTRIKLK
jgi:hypothetical protein